VLGLNKSQGNPIEKYIEQWIMIKHFQFLFLLCLSFSACHNPSIKGNGEPCFKELKLIEIKQTGVFDTTTTVIDGMLIDLEKNIPYSNLSLHFDSFETTTDTTGHFKFNHISINNPKVFIKEGGSLKFIGILKGVGSGAKFNIKIGVKCKGSN
jgi:hypothetical protein